MINVRQAQEKDAEAIAQAQLAMALETEDMQLDLATVRLGVAAVFKDPTKGGYYVAETDNKVIGVLLTTPEWSDWRNGTVLWIHSLYIEPKFRAKGVFKQMYEYLKTMVEKSREYRGLRLYVDKRNTKAQKVYERLGMSAEHYSLYEWLKG